MGQVLDGSDDGFETRLMLCERRQDQHDSLGRAHRLAETIDQNQRQAPLHDSIEGSPEQPRLPACLPVPGEQDHGDSIVAGRSDDAGGDVQIHVGQGSHRHPGRHGADHGMGQHLLRERHLLLHVAILGDHLERIQGLVRFLLPQQQSDVQQLLGSLALL